MEGSAIFQISASVTASLCTGTSFFIWLSLITKGDLTRLLLLSKKPTILAQAGLGIVILTGSLASFILALYRPVFRGGEYRSYNFFYDSAESDLQTHQDPLTNMILGHYTKNYRFT
jgi:hypothetical protein